MRKLSLLLVATLLLMPAVSQAKPLDDLLADKGVIAAGGTDGRTYYKGGTRLDYGSDFDMKLNLQVQTRYEYEEFDESAATDRPDTSGFDLRRVRLIFGGNMLDRTWSYKVQNDFAGESDLKDAWLQWNGDGWLNFRMGQMKTPLGRQFNVSSAKLQIMDRSPISELFDLGRQNGVMAHGGDDGIGYKLGVFNGESDGEGRNAGPTDNNVQGIGQITFSDNYGNRGEEGDMGMTNGLGWTAGAAVGFGQGQTGGTDFDKTDVNVDVGLRSGGMSFQAEYFYSETDPDGGVSVDANAFYAQAGYQFNEQCEAAVRFSYLDPDKSSTTDDLEEVYIGLNHFINGHSLKVQTGIAWETENFDGGSDLTDLTFQLQLGGYF